MGVENRNVGGKPPRGADLHEICGIDPIGGFVHLVLPLSFTLTTRWRLRAAFMSFGAVGIPSLSTYSAVSKAAQQISSSRYPWHGATAPLGARYSLALT